MKNSSDQEPKQTVEKQSTNAGHHPKMGRTQYNFRMPDALLNHCRAESSRTGRGVSDIIIEQLWKRYADHLKTT